MIKAIIADDEINGLERLRESIAGLSIPIEIIGEARSSKETQELLQREDIQPDVAFLDINLGDEPVFNLLDRIEENIDFEIIFVSGEVNFAIEACSYSSIGFILKPASPEKLEEMVLKINPTSRKHIKKRVQMMKEYYNNPNTFKKMTVSGLDGVYFIDLEDITRMEAEDNYTHIFFNDGSKITSSKTLKFYDNMLKHASFFRVHKGHLVNLNYMKKYVKGAGGYIIMHDDTTITVSRRKRVPFMDKIRRSQGGGEV